MKKWTKNWTTPIRVLLAGMGVGAAALLVPMIVSAVLPPAGQSIGNKAAASYVDAAGQEQKVESNPVSTTVAQIGDMTLTDSNTKSVAPGTTAYMPHTLTNTGNGSDTFTITAVDAATGPGAFTSVAIYPDANGTGTPSSLTPLCATPLQGSAPLCSTGFDQLLAPNGPFRFIVAYQLPSTATAPTAPYDTGTVTAKPKGTTVPYVTATLSNTDTVNTTDLAAFTATKALVAPGVSPPSGTWPTALTTGKASPASCTTDATATVWAANLVSTHPLCTYTVYTLSYTNNGGATGNFSINDVIGTAQTAGLTYVTGSAVWSGAGGTALSENGGTTGTGTSQVKSTWDSGTKTFKATVTNVPATVSGTISFVVMVDSDATVGEGATNNIGKFWSTTCDSTIAASATNCANTATPPSSTNPSPFPIPVTYGVTATNASGLTTPDAGSPPDDSGINLVTAPTVAPGGSVSFTNWITNTGNAIDSFKLSVASQSGVSGTAAFPAGTTYAFYKADGLTPMVTPDTGPLAPGASIAVVVRATIPANTATAGTTPYEALLTATSDNTTGVSDSVWDRVLDVIPPVVKVDLTNTTTGDKFIDGINAPVACTPGSNCDLGQGPSPNPTDIQYTTPGTGVSFPLFVKNTDSAPGTVTYNLTAPSLPTGWTVKFVAGTDSCATGASITQVSATSPATLPVPQAAVACVTPPANTPVGTTNVFFKVTSSTDPAIHDTITDAVTVQAPVIKALSLTPTTTSSTASGNGTVINPATLTNIGNQNCGGSTGFTVSTEFTDPTLAAAGWSAAVYFDRVVIGSIGNEDTLLGSGVANLTPAIAQDPVGSPTMIPLLPGKALPLLVKIFAPANALNGTVATVKLTVSDANTVTADQCPTQSSTFTTTISNGQLRIDKTQALDALCDGAADTAYSAVTIPVVPGQCIAYKVVAHNDGAASVTKVVINDAAPEYTTYQAAPVAGTCVPVGGTGTSTFAAVGQAVSCSTAAAGLTLAPAGTLTMQFNVKVDK